MWDTIYTPEALKRAQDHYTQLHDIWKDEITKGTRIVRFRNTQPSAVEIITELDGWDKLLPIQFNPGDNTRLASLVFAELLHRIQQAQLERQIIITDQIQLFTHPNPNLTTSSSNNRDLESILISSLKDVNNRLSVYIRLIQVNTCTPPNLQCIAYETRLEITLTSYRFLHAAERVLAHLSLSLSLSSPGLPSNDSRRMELSAIVSSAMADFERDYLALCALGFPPLKLWKAHLRDHIKLEALYRRIQMQRLVNLKKR
ncbi:hypothetical protein CVT24_006401 [Panaeolus cyanescens]|uniref:Uncharacterized protein n=1 Tax=Panaeolus cyanescens TaxID=181874 RepID=A0A409WZK8_9AGAR|nr:hypothetical protein CVT24_006401 [Panaeolus cyanescens]